MKFFQLLGGLAFLITVLIYGGPTHASMSDPAAISDVAFLIGVAMVISAL